MALRLGDLSKLTNSSFLRAAAAGRLYRSTSFKPAITGKGRKKFYWTLHSTADPSSDRSVTMTTKPIELYTLGTPNGHKLNIGLEEFGLPYNLHVINIRNGDQFTNDFKAINPNSKIPAIVDPDGPGGERVPIFESGAILLYLAEKTGKLIPKDPIKRLETIQWLFWQMAGQGPMFGQLGHFFVYAPEKIEYGIKRYSTEAKRLLGVLDKQLEGKKYVTGDEYTIADIAIAPWVNALRSKDEGGFYGAKAAGVDYAEFPNVKRWFEDWLTRPAVQKGLKLV